MLNKKYIFLFLTAFSLFSFFYLVAHGQLDGSPLQCADGLDNDGDGKIDSADPGCTDRLDDDEFDREPSLKGEEALPSCAPTDLRCYPFQGFTFVNPEDPSSPADSIRSVTPGLEDSLRESLFYIAQGFVLGSTFALASEPLKWHLYDDLAGRAGRLKSGPRSVIATSEYNINSGFGDVSIKWSSGNRQRMVLDGDATVFFDFGEVDTPPPPERASAGQNLQLIVCQSNGGNHLITWSGSIFWAGGVLPTPTSTNGKCDVYNFLVTSFFEVPRGFETRPGLILGSMVPDF